MLDKIENIKKEIIKVGDKQEEKFLENYYKQMY